MTNLYTRPRWLMIARTSHFGEVVMGRGYARVECRGVVPHGSCQFGEGLRYESRKHAREAVDAHMIFTHTTKSDECGTPRCAADAAIRRQRSRLLR